MIKTLLIYAYGESNKETKDSKEFPKPKKYEEFISNIAKSFNIKNKKEINLMVFTTDGDEIPIHDQEDLESYCDEASEYRAIVEKKESEKSSGGQLKVKEKKEDSDDDDNDDNKKEEKKPKKEDEKKKEESDLENDGDEEINIKLNVNLEIPDKELENLIEGQIKDIPDIDNNIINDDLQFNIDEFKTKLTNKNNNIIDNFNKSFESKINNIVINKSNIMKETINNSVLNFSKINIENLNHLNKETKVLNLEFGEISENSNDMNDALKKISEGIGQNPMPNPKPNLEQNSKPNQNPKPNPIRNIISDEEDNDDDKNKLNIKFEKENKEVEIEKKNARFLEIENIIISNIGNKTYKKLFFVIDENESSSKDIFFLENSKNQKAHKLSLNGDFTPNKREEHSFVLKITNPEPSKIYTLCIYVKENEVGNNLSKAFKINVKIKEEQEKDQNKILEENAKKLLPTLEQNYNLAILCSKEELLKKIIDLNNNIDSINEWIGGEFKKKADNFYRELKMEAICGEDEGKGKILELKFDKEKINDWIKKKEQEIEEKKLDDLYKSLDAEFGISDKLNKDEVLKIIKDKNFERESIIEWIKQELEKKKPSSDPQNRNDNPLPGNADNEKLNQMIELFDNEYNILNILEDEDEFKQKIIELDYNEEKIRDWIEEKLGA